MEIYQIYVLDKKEQGFGRPTGVAFGSAVAIIPLLIELIQSLRTFLEVCSPAFDVESTIFDTTDEMENIKIESNLVLPRCRIV